MKNILIVSIENDIHAMAVAHEINRQRLATAHILEVDRLSARCRVSWSADLPSRTYIQTGATKLALEAIDAIWWRRSRSDQRTDLEYPPAQADLINNDWRGSIRGALEAGHKGSWISHPVSTEAASNKLMQLAVASQCGFRVPRTLVSNDPETIKSFIGPLPCGAIVKPVVGTKHELLYTQIVDPNRLADEAISSVPAIYQEFIPGTDHLRINCFGAYVQASIIRSNDLDWRRNLRNAKVEPWEVPKELELLLETVLGKLNLAMGVFDLKIASTGEIVWFEVNPQGQFLFLEGLTNAPLLQEFSRFLTEYRALQPNYSLKRTDQSLRD